MADLNASLSSTINSVNLPLAVIHKKITQSLALIINEA
ncbi:hypothetical protein CEV31_3205 [Brucella thiophenivorans]|uniref:Uncharacterized protein n=1 Tax=Brucella thiophenivorans TaxID=571255 RepID=A0A256FIW2_9HYPH|nr:hypothetical protein CEV31_3205 [Brucella thiophenivorans]